MLSNDQQREIHQKIQLLSLEAVSLDELGEQILPQIENLFETSASLLYRCDETGSLVPINGTLTDICEAYGQHENSVDPLHSEESRLNLPVSFLSRFQVWKDYLRSSAFNEFMHPRDADYLLHIRLTDTDFHAPGMVGLVLARSFRQPDFGKKEEKSLSQILEPLRAVTKRSRRVAQKLGLAEALLDTKSRDEIALNLEGRLLWASQSARSRLGLHGDYRTWPPEALVAAARKLGERWRNKAVAKHYFSDVTLPLKDGSMVRVELRLVPAASGDCLVLAEIESHDISPGTLDRLLAFDLTNTEIKVLCLVAQGLSDAEISRRLFVSHATIRTHVGSILGKLGVQSRVQAALLAHGFHTKPHP